MLFENEEAEFKLPFGQEVKAGGSSEEEEDEEAEEKKPETKAGSGGFMSKFSLAGIILFSKLNIYFFNLIHTRKRGRGGLCPNSASQV